MSATPAPTFEQVQIAGRALRDLYDAWEANGGPSPDTRDEQRVVAEALGLEPNYAEPGLERIWEAAMDPETFDRGAECQRLGRMHAVQAMEGAA